MVKKHTHAKRKKKAPHHKRRHPLPFNFISGLIYVGAVVLCISLGAMFYKGYKNARSEMDEGATPSTQSLGLPPGAKVVNKQKWEQERNRKTAPKRTPRPAETPTPVPVTHEQQAVTSREKAPGTPVIPLTEGERPAWKHTKDPVMGTLQNITIVASADTTLFASPEQMQNRNLGGQEELYLNGNHCFTINNYNVAPIQGWTVHKASWHGKVKSGRIRTLTFSSIATPWTEGSGSLDKPADNGATFLWATMKKEPWDQEGDPAWCALRGNNQTFCSYSSYVELSQQAGEWITVDIDPLLVQSLIAGHSEGIAIFDACGQATFSNIVLFSRETEGSHYLEVEGELIDIEAPGMMQQVACEAPERLRRKDSAGVALSWVAPGDDGNEGQAYRYDVRYSAVSDSFERALRVPQALIPWPPMPAGYKDAMEITGLAPASTYNIFIRAMDECGQPGPHTMVSVKTP
ncbi:MAG: hypothetical protein EOM20_08060, partial [Spartobacteria bacterium]|nr:hypothetical protein [Spartobacteria bacterium]